MKGIKKILAAAIALSMLSLCACNESTETVGENGFTEAGKTVTSENVSNIEVKEISDKDKAAPSPSDGEKITLNGDTADSGSDGVTISDGKVTITRAGIYTLSGDYSGQIVIAAGEKDDVNIILDGANITSEVPIYCASADKLIITLCGKNTIVGSAAVDSDIDGAIFSEETIVINGDGELNITSTARGITSKDGIRITGEPTLNISSADHALRGKDYISADGGIINIVTTAGDGVKASSSDSGKGYISIAGGSWNITAAEDGIQAESEVIISGGEFNITSGGGSGNGKTHTEARGRGGFSASDTSDSDISTKGIKGGTAVTITGGSFTADCADDSIHSNGSVNIGGGNFTLSTGDDGIHADEDAVISGGNIRIEKSYEGIEGSNITVGGGEIYIVSSDDGLNAAGGNDGSGWDFHGENGNHLITVDGGNIYINAAGDGIDSNGSVVQSGGEIIVEGPENNGNGALDYGGSYTMSGGTLLAVGAVGMAQSVSADSPQAAVSVNSQGKSGSVINISDESGEIFTFTASKTFQNIVFSTGGIKKGDTLTVTVDGNSSTATAGENSGFGGGFGGGGFGGGGRGGRDKGEFNPDNMPEGGEMPSAPSGGRPDFGGRQKGEKPDFGGAPSGGDAPDFGDIPSGGTSGRA